MSGCQDQIVTKKNFKILSQLARDPNFPSRGPEIETEDLG